MYIMPLIKISGADKEIRLVSHNNRSVFFDIWDVINSFTCESLLDVGRAQKLHRYNETAIITGFTQYLTGNITVKRKVYLYRIMALFSQ